MQNLESVAQKMTELLHITFEFGNIAVGAVVALVAFL